MTATLLSPLRRLYQIPRERENELIKDDLDEEIDVLLDRLTLTYGHKVALQYCYKILPPHVELCFQSNLRYPPDLCTLCQSK